MTAIKKMRKLLNISQCDLAKAIGVTQGAISQWETGTAKPTLENLVAIAKVFGCKVDDLIDK